EGVARNERAPSAARALGTLKRDREFGAPQIPRADRVQYRMTPSLAIGDQPTVSQARVAQGNSGYSVFHPPGAASSPGLIASAVPLVRRSPGRLRERPYQAVRQQVMPLISSSR